MSHKTPIYLVLSGIACAGLACAQANEALTFSESALPAGVVRGVINAGGRCGALIAGGKTVYSNDVFTVTTRGHKVMWKVLEVSDRTNRFARASSPAANPLSPAPDCRPNFGGLAMLLEQGAQSYKAASTRALKDQVMAETREGASGWCASNRTLCVTGTLSDLTVTDANTARLRLTDVDCGPFSAIKRPTLYMHRPLQFTVPMTKERALSCKAGYTVILTGRPVFQPGVGLLMVDGLVQKQSVTSFMMPVDLQCIGALTVTGVRYDIFDPKAETVQQK